MNGLAEFDVDIETADGVMPTFVAQLEGVLGELFRVLSLPQASSRALSHCACVQEGGAQAPGSQLQHMLELGRLVIEQDSRACEMNQRGLKSISHRHGVLVPQEYAVHEFHQWLRRRCAAHR